MPLVATTTRRVCFALMDDPGRRTLVNSTKTMKVGTKVYATERRDGTFTIRIPGTLWEAHVYASTLAPA